LLGLGWKVIVDSFLERAPWQKKDRKVLLYILFGLVFYDEPARGPNITKQYGLFEIDQTILSCSR
jgi:hypothetical protein